MYSFKLEFLSFLDVCPGVGLLDHMVALFLVSHPGLFKRAIGRRLWSRLNCRVWTAPRHVLTSGVHRAGNSGYVYAAVLALWSFCSNSVIS